MRCAPIRNLGSASAVRPDLSVVVPIGAMVGRLTNLISWISEITLSSIEVILIVDEKLDGTYLELFGILSALELKCKVVLLNDVCDGPGNARNLGLRHVTGIWVVFWDSDDLPNVVETLESIEASATSTQVIVCKYSKILQSGHVKVPRLDFLNIALNPGLWRFIFKYELIEDSKFPNLKLGEDQVFLLTSGALSQRLFFSERINYRYVLSGSNQLTRQDGNSDHLGEAVKLMLSHRVNVESWNLNHHFRKVMIARLLLTSLKRDWRNTFQNVATPIKATFIILIAIPSIVTLRFSDAK